MVFQIDTEVHKPENRSAYADPFPPRLGHLNLVTGDEGDFQFTLQEILKTVPGIQRWNSLYLKALEIRRSLKVIGIRNQSDFPKRAPLA